jgi:hypothetical protein
MLRHDLIAIKKAMEPLLAKFRDTGMEDSALAANLADVALKAISEYGYVSPYPPGRVTGND